MTNTMMVVIMVSRRVGQVTFAVSERTSCRNLNGLTAIVENPYPSSDKLNDSRDPNSPLSPSPHDRRLSRHASSIVREFQKPRRISAINGPAAGGGYVLRQGPNVKISGRAWTGGTSLGGWFESSCPS